MAEPIFIIEIGPDGTVATHPPRVDLPKAVAPVPEDRIDKDFNAVRPELVTLGCMRLNEKPGFAFDSSMIGPAAAERFTHFVKMMQALRKLDPRGANRYPPLSVFGHADPTGDPPYNKKLSGRRARSVYAVLVRKTAIWDELYLNPHGGDQWSYKAIQLMLTVPLRKNEPPFYTGAPDGAKTKATQDQTRDALKKYQESRKLPQTGFANDATRTQLFKEYMDYLCHDADGNAFKLDPAEHFIARNKDKGLKGDVQGCGEFNPSYIPMKEDQDRWDKAKDEASKEERNAAFAECRRVVVYVFRHDTEVDPQKWPCPVAETGGKDCEKRFWSDADVRIRRKEGEERKFLDTRDTMQCRFYHAFAFPSPCEAGMRLWQVRFRIALSKESAKPVPVAGRRYVVQCGAAATSVVLRSRTDDEGEVAIPVFDEATTITLKLDAWDVLFPSYPKPKKEPDDPGGDTFPDEDKFMSFELDAGSLKLVTDDKNMAAKQRLHNLGFGKGLPGKEDDFKAAVKDYRRARDGKRGVTKGDTLDDPTLESLRLEHDVEKLSGQDDRSE